MDLKYFKKTKLKTTNLNYETPFVVISGYALNENVQKYIEYGFAGFISKPVNLEKVNDVVFKVIHKPQDIEDFL
jgi:YesN/AraC family two-component response regulator